LLLILLLTGAGSAVTALQPWPLKMLVDYALSDAPAPEWLQTLIASLSLRPTALVLVVAAALGSLALFLLGSALEASLNLSWAVAGQRMVYGLAADLFGRLQNLSLSFHNRHPVGDSLSRLTGDVYGVFTLAEGLLIAPIQQVLTLGLLGALAWHLDPQLTLLSLAVVPAMSIFALLLGRRLKRRSRAGREAQSRLMSFVHQTLTAMPLVQAFDAGARNRTQFDSLAEDAVALSQRGALLNSAVGLAAGLSRSAGLAIVVYFGGMRVVAGDLTVGSLLVFLAYARSMHGAGAALLALYAKVKSAEVSLERVSEVFLAKETIIDAPDAQPLPKLRNGSGVHLRLDGVTFGYTLDRPVLKDVSLEAHVGEILAIIGPTGAGKSTLVSLIFRFFDPWRGRVTLDGTDIRHVQLSSLRAQVAWVPQDPLLLPMTIGENIRYGRPEATNDEVRAAAAAARAAEFIERLPEGYDTVIGQRGATLSGGEKQRLAIARALLKDAPVLILDEPTSALDSETEALLIEAIENLTVGRTTLIIAHRLSTVRRADWIVALDMGRIRQIGRPQKLLTNDSLYGHLVLARGLKSESGEVLS